MRPDRDMKPTPATQDISADRADALMHDVYLGCLDEALAILDSGHLDAAGPQVSRLADVVASELARRADHLCQELVEPAVVALGISSPLAETLVIDAHDRVHLVAGRQLDENAMTEELLTTCGQVLFDDIDEPLPYGMRGCWREAELFEVERCPRCAAHAAAYPETEERVLDPTLPAGVAAGIRASVCGAVSASLRRGLAYVASRGAMAALEAAEETYERTLVAHLVAHMRAGGDAVLRRTLLRYFARAEHEARACGHTGPLAELLDADAFCEAADGVVFDLGRDDAGAAAVDVYSVLRIALDSRIRAMQEPGGRRPAA